MGAQHHQDTATSRMRLLHNEFLEHPRTAPDGPRARTVTAGTPVNLAVVDHITAAVAEVAEHTRSVNPGAGPLPQDVADVYDWYRQHTEHADDIQRQRGETIVYRQRLEHAIAMGDDSVIPPHRCPGCRTWGLLWRRELQRALCTNMRCQTRDGMSRTWTLARLAYEHVAVEKMSRECAT